MRWREGAGERDEPGTNGRLGTTDRRRERERASEWREREREPASGEEEWKGFGERGSSETVEESSRLRPPQIFLICFSFFFNVIKIETLITAVRFKMKG